MNQKADDDSDGNEVYVSVDIEAAGPVPGEYSMLSLGACVVGATDRTFYAELRPINDRFVAEALAVSGLTMERLIREGRSPADVMAEFGSWALSVSKSANPVFVGFNAGFDWSFVNWYFHVFGDGNPFGIGALDIKAYAMGLTGSTWRDTSASRLPQVFRATQPLTHNPLEDAIAQSEVFVKLLATDRASTQTSS